MSISGDGRIEVEDGINVWYEVVGEGGGISLLTLHGSPGSGHDHIESLADLAVDRPVVFYDQLGCGRSDRPDDPSRWVIERFTREIDTGRSLLGLDRVHLVGRSWGGWLAIEYMSGPRAGSPHLCRMEEWPESVMRTVANLDGNQVYLTINGPDEFTTIGSLKDWDRSSSLGDSRVPTLITCGRIDEPRPNSAATPATGIPDVRMVAFEHSTHLAPVEERERHIQILDKFFQDHDEHTPSQPPRASSSNRIDLTLAGTHRYRVRTDSGARGREFEPLPRQTTSSRYDAATLGSWYCAEGEIAGSPEFFGSEGRG